MPIHLADVNGNRVIVRIAAKFKGGHDDDDRGKAEFLVRVGVSFLDRLGTAHIWYTGRSLRSDA